MAWSAGPPGPLFLSLEHVAMMFAWDRSTLYRHIREGRFPRPRRIAGQWRYTQEDIDAYVLLADRWQPGPFDEEAPKKAGKKPSEEGGEAEI